MNSSLRDDNNYALRVGILKRRSGSSFCRIFAVGGVRHATDKGLNPMPAAQISVRREQRSKLSYHPRNTPTLRPAVTVYQVSPADLSKLYCWQCWHVKPKGTSTGIMVEAEVGTAGLFWSTEA